MKSIADGGVCHQFHYAGVVTKIISMIDEMATRPHAEIMPDARESGTLRGALRKRVKLTCNFFFFFPAWHIKIIFGAAQTSRKIQFDCSSRVRDNPTLCDHNSSGLRLQWGIIIVGKKQIKLSTSHQPRVSSCTVHLSGCVPNMPGGLRRPQLRQRTGERDVSP